MQKTIETAKVEADGRIKLPQDAIKIAGLRRGETISVVPLNKTLILGKISRKFLEAMQRMDSRKKKISPEQVKSLIQKVRYGV